MYGGAQERLLLTVNVGVLFVLWLWLSQTELSVATGHQVPNVSEVCMVHQVWGAYENVLRHVLYQCTVHEFCVTLFSLIIITVQKMTPFVFPIALVLC
jgi:hypothetical protein